MFCPILDVKYWASAAMRGIVLRAYEESTARNIYSRTHPLSPPFSALASPPHCRSAAPEPPLASPERPTAVSRRRHRRVSATPIWRRASVDLAMRRAAGCGALTTDDHVLVETTRNMTHPRCSMEFSQGMCRHRRAHLFARFLFTSSSEFIYTCL
jgi:hypothetical protein